MSKYHVVRRDGDPQGACIGIVAGDIQDNPEMYTD